MKKIYLSLLVCFISFIVLMIVSCGTASAQGQSAYQSTIYQFGIFEKAEKVNGIWTPVGSFDIGYGFDQILLNSDSLGIQLTSFESANIGHSFDTASGKQIVNSMPISAGFSIKITKYNISFGGGGSYDLWINKFYPIFKMDFTLEAASNLFGARMSPAKKRNHGLRVIL